MRSTSSHDLCPEEPCALCQGSKKLLEEEIELLEYVSWWHCDVATLSEEEGTLLEHIAVTHSARYSRLDLVLEVFDDVVTVTNRRNLVLDRATDFI